MSILALFAAGIVGLIGAVITFYTIVNPPFDKLLTTSRVESYATLMFYVLVPRFIASAIFAFIISLMLLVVFKYVLKKKLLKSALLLVFIILSILYLGLIFPKKVLLITNIPEPPNTISRAYHYDKGAACFDTCDSANVVFLTKTGDEELLAFYQKRLGNFRDIYPYPNYTSFYVNNRLNGQITKNAEGNLVSFSAN